MFINGKKKKEEEEEEREKKTEVPSWPLEMNSRETMSFTEVESINLIKHMMQYWKQSDRVSVDAEWQAPRVALLALRRQTVLAVSMEQTAGQEWALFSHTWMIG